MKDRLDSTNGIRLVILDNGSKRYEARINRAGVPAKSKRFKTKEEAKAWKREMDSAIDKDLPLPESKPKLAKGTLLTRNQVDVQPERALLADVIDAYIKFRDQSPSPLPGNKLTDYERVKGDLGSFALCDLRYEDVVNYIGILRKEPIKQDAGLRDKGLRYRTYAEATVRKFLTALRMAVQWYAKVKRLSLDPHLFEIEKGFMPKAWSNKRDRRLTRAEEQKLYEAGLQRGDFTYTRQDWEALIGFALETAMRLQEIVQARWDDLVTDDLKLKVRAANTKTRTDRIVLLSKRAREIVASQRKTCPDKEARIFYQFRSSAAVTEAFGRLTKRAGVPNFHFHDLRHEATSRLCESGKLSQMHIMNMTGHSSMTTFQGYVHLMNHETTPTLD